MNYAGIAQVKLLRGDLDAAEAQVRMAARLADGTGAHFWSAEIKRLDGLIALAKDPTSSRGLELCREAAQLAERQGARVFELRARLSLCERSDDPTDLKALGQLLEAGAGASLPEAAVAERLLADRL